MWSKKMINYIYVSRNAKSMQNPCSVTQYSFGVLRSWLMTICIPLLIVLFLNTYIIKFVIVKGDSMYPSLYNNNLIIIRQIQYTPMPQDIVLLRSQLRASPGELIVKRIIAIEGQTVVIDYHKNLISVDNEILYEPYINYEQADPLQEINGSDGGVVEYVVPRGCVFVMGDNRNFSMDSRNDRIGMFRYEDIVGSLILNIPFGKII